ncbi:hypothetical protein [Nocardia brasiliensis]|uniref:Transmembrane protein n=1 Tax=Nocardia brasiliensis (strain ATCC 700358 / HUJEG-1) TaxID=1133849 RepID=K0F6X6_NOCB7|nr:hypothetical protein [Nocardia brasiliensis]AFU05487.1 hypothetical protein O3I_037700 [Nocardia brasiliensis ATCC 700358]OCF86239.1 hypothetical protein AW168_32855 [Nocardia brasiliensis]
MDTVAQHILWLFPMLWLGMVLAISFLEAPLKFRAPGITVPLGLGIGRLVFRVLNAVEAVLAVLLVIAAAIVGATTGTWIWLLLAVVVLAGQIVLVRPPLSKRADRVLAGEDLPRSHAHFWYIGLEVVKVVGLIGLAISAVP